MCRVIALQTRDSERKASDGLDEPRRDRSTMQSKQNKKAVLFTVKHTIVSTHTTHTHHLVRGPRF